jgi:hypothetical protein
MRTFFRFILLAAGWLSSYAVMANEGNGLFKGIDAAFSQPGQSNAARQLEAVAAINEEGPDAIHAVERGEHADNDAHLRSRQLQWRSMRFEATETLLSVRKFSLLQTQFSYFSFNPWIDYTDPHLLYSYRLFLF